MRPILATADIHLSADSAELVLGRVLPATHAEAKANGCRDTVVIGDLWEIRYRYEVWLLNALMDFLVKDPTMVWHFLRGNHDQVDVSGQHALRALRELPNVLVYDHPCRTELGFWVPYADRDTVVAWLRELAKSEDACTSTLFGHFGVLGASMGSIADTSDGIPPEELAPFGRVYLGHYHRAQAVTPNAIYVGSPWQTSASEAGETKYVVVVKEKDHTHIPLDVSPRFWRLAAATAHDLKQDLGKCGVREQDDVRVELTGDLTVDEATVILRALGVRRFVVTPKAEVAADRLVVETQNTSGPEIEDYYRAYVEAKKGDLDAGTLLDFFRNIRAEAAK